MPDLIPKVVAIGSKQEKGRALERAVGAVWSELGYRKLRFNAFATGEEIDVYGRHVVSGDTLKGQCKAHARRTDAPTLRLFFGDVEKERGANKRLAGIFVSLSGFTGTAEKWHEELAQEQRDYFHLADGFQFLCHLAESGVVVSVATLLAQIKKQSSLVVSDVCLLLTDRGIYWKVVFADQNVTDAYYALLVGSGDLPRAEDIEYLEERILPTSAARISLRGRESVVSILLREGRIVLKELPGKASESFEDTNAVVESLRIEGLVRVDNGEVSLRHELDAVLVIARMALSSPLESAFMGSEFYSAAREQLLIPFLQGKFVAEFEPAESETLKRILSISPRALSRVLSGDAEQYRNTEEHLKALNMGGAELAKHRKNSRTQLIGSLTRDLVVDMNESDAFKLLDRHNIILIRTSLETKLATRQAPFLSLKSISTVQIGTASGPIKAGQLVFSSDPGPVISGADAYLAMGEFDLARETYDFVIANWPGTEPARAALHNKAICSMSVRHFDEAIELLKTLLDSDLRTYALKNIAKCHEEKGDALAAEETLKILRKEGADFELDSTLPTKVRDAPSGEQREFR